MIDQFQYWRDALAGKQQEIHADHPQPGIYYLRNGKGGERRPVWIWEKDGVIHASIGKVERTDPHKIWTWCADKPCTKADAEYWLEHKKFPGEVDEPPSIGDNSGDLSLKDRLLSYMETARAWLSKTKVTDQVTCDMAANYASELTTLKNRLDNERKAKVQPHLDAQRDINGEYNPTIKDADELAKAIKRATDGFLIAEKRRLEEEARKKYEAELAERRKAEEAAAKANIPPPEPVAPVAPPAPVKVQAGGQKGKKMALRTYVTYEIEDWQKVVGWAIAPDHAHPDVVDAIEKAAKAACRDGVAVPGMKKVVEERAA